MTAVDQLDDHQGHHPRPHGSVIEDIANWVNSTMAEMKAEGGIIQNTWRRHGYKRCLGDKDAGKQAVGGGDEGEEEAI